MLRAAGVQTERDLTQREAALRKQNSVLSSLLANIPVDVCLAEASTGLPLAVNATAERLLGRGIVPGATLEELAEVYRVSRCGNPGPYPSAEMPIRWAVQGQASHVDDMLVQRPDGGRTQLEVFGSPVADEQARVRAGLVSFLDTTERRRAQDRIARLSQLCAALSRCTPVIVHCRDAVGVGGMRMAWIGLVEQPGHWVRPVAVHGDLDG